MPCARPKGTLARARKGFLPIAQGDTLGILFGSYCRPERAKAYYPSYCCCPSQPHSFSGKRSFASDYRPASRNPLAELPSGCGGSASSAE